MDWACKQVPCCGPFQLAVSQPLPGCSAWMSAADWPCKQVSCCSRCLPHRITTAAWLQCLDVSSGMAMQTSTLLRPFPTHRVTATARLQCLDVSRGLGMQTSTMLRLLPGSPYHTRCPAAVLGCQPWTGRAERPGGPRRSAAGGPSGSGRPPQLRQGRLKGAALHRRVNAHNAAATNRSISMPAWLQKPGMRTAFSVHITPSMHHAQQERHTTHLCAPERASRGCRSCSAQPHQHRQTQPPAGVEEHATLKGQARRQVGRAPPKQSTATHLLRLQHGLLATHATHLLRLQCGQVSIDLRRFQLPEQSVQIDVWWLRCCHHCCAAVAARLLHCAAAAAGVAAATPAHGDAVLS